MKKKIAIFAFNGENMCFVHALLNALDLHEKGYDTRLIIEGSVTKLIPELAQPDHTFHKLYTQVVEKDLIDCVCRACANKMGVLKEIEALGLPFHDELKGHPSFDHYLEQGYEIISL